VTQASDTPTSQSTAARWTFYRRLGLLLRTRLDDEGTTLSLSDVAARTHGRVSVEQLTSWLEQGALAQPDAVSCVLLAQAFDVDPDYFVTDEAVASYIANIRNEFATLGSAEKDASLQMQAYLVAMRAAEAVVA
jgi:transcriptional regulator with XRE-family HTH domain